MLIDRFKQHIKENELLKAGDRVLLAVSGGVDSMSMLSLFAQCEWPAGVAHCNFGLRGDLLSQKGEFKEALAMYRRAIEATDNSTTTPYFLKKAGLVSEQLGETAAALAFYQRIVDEFGMSMEARDIEKSIGALKQQ